MMEMARDVQQQRGKEQEHARNIGQLQAQDNTVVISIPPEYQHI